MLCCMRMFFWQATEQVTMVDIQITFQHWHFENRSQPTYLCKLILKPVATVIAAIFFSTGKVNLIFLDSCMFVDVFGISTSLLNWIKSCQTRRWQLASQREWKLLVKFSSTIQYCKMFFFNQKQISFCHAHIETSRELRLVDKLFPGLVDWNYKTSQMHRRTLLKVEVKNESHICGVPRNDAGSYSGLIFHRYSARPLLLAYSMAVGWANQIRMQRIRQDWFVYLRIQSLLCDDLIAKSPVRP